MPVQHARVGGRHRVVEAETGKPAMDEQGEPIDGGGYDSADEAIAQVQAINGACRASTGQRRHDARQYPRGAVWDAANDAWAWKITNAAPRLQMPGL